MSETTLPSLTPNEQRILDCISTHSPVRLEQIAQTVFPSFDSVKGNSWVRNGLRKLRDKLHLVQKVGRGEYSLAHEVTLPRETITPELISGAMALLQVKPILCLPPIRPVLLLPPKTGPRPKQLSTREAMALTMETVSKVKNLHCTFYNECLTMAFKGGWESFGCHECSAFEEMTSDQKMSDLTTLFALDQAATNLESEGCAGRKRGVRPGPDARGRKRLKVVTDEAA